MSEIINNTKLYLQLLQAAEEAAAVGLTVQEESIIEEMDNLWHEMTSAERQAVDAALGMNLGFGD